MRRIGVFLTACIFITQVRAAELFTKDEPVIDNLSVIEMSGVFADIYGKLDKVRWGGKDIRIAIESLESIAKDVHIAATDQRIVVLHKDTIVGNWPKPEDGNWDEYGQVTTAIILKLREVVPELARMDEPRLYKVMVSAIMKGIDENGKYIYSQKEAIATDPRALTSLGIAGVRTSSGDYILNTIFKGSPADAAGLTEGDILTYANGVALRSLSDMEILGLFNGFSSGTIKIKAVDKNKQEKNVVLRRASVVIADADIVLLNKNGSDGKLLEIIIHRLTDNSAQIVVDALVKYKAEISGIYLDLRSATGDDELAMAKIAGLFLGRVPVARISAILQSDTEIVPGGDAVVPDMPIVIAVSGATKGTAEGLAFAFHENNVGVIIGVPTSGSARLASKIDLDNGGALELLNRTMKTGQGNQIDGRGFFPMVCLSNIRTSEQKEVFLVSVRNHEWGARDYNYENVDPAVVRKGCPNIVSGSDEDSVATAVAMDILFDDVVYPKLGRKDVSE